MSFNKKIQHVLEATDDKSGVKAKKPHGRPKAKATIKKEYDDNRKDFIENYKSIDKSHPEPEYLVRALSYPEDEIQEQLEVALGSRRVAYCREYVLDFNRKQAALRAGYTEQSSDSTSFRLMKYRSVQKLISIYQNQGAKRITSINPDYVIQKVTEIVATATKDSDKLRGLELLARHLGMFIERTEITGKDGEAIRFEETRKEADEVARRLREMGSKTQLTTVK